MTNTETERQGVILAHYAYCRTCGVQKRKSQMNYWEYENDKYFTCDYDCKRPPKGKKAVTFYIPEGMTVGQALHDAAIEKYKSERGLHGIGSSRSIIEALQEFNYKDAEQIQEAIDKTFNQEK